LTRAFGEAEQQAHRTNFQTDYFSISQNFARIWTQLPCADAERLCRFHVLSAIPFCG
jgi:hypothetical protein